MKEEIYAFRNQVKKMLKIEDQIQAMKNKISELKFVTNYIEEIDYLQGEIRALEELNVDELDDELEFEMIKQDENKRYKNCLCFHYNNGEEQLGTYFCSKSKRKRFMKTFLRRKERKAFNIHQREGMDQDDPKWGMLSDSNLYDAKFIQQEGKLVCYSREQLVNYITSYNSDLEEELYFRLKEKMNTLINWCNKHHVKLLNYL